ncbi:response regulator [Dokdonella sp. MW10]|uniref:response regulator n=1 Tax=Dokdonella sp. MW10 TaxID=2992926 RepID=UPI003F7F3AD4
MADLPTIAFIDDEERILRSLRMLFRGRANVLATTSAPELLDWVRTREVHAVVSDQRMPGMGGVEVLREVAARSPSTMRLLLTGYADMDAVVGSVNDGEIYRFLEKPWDGPRLVETVLGAAAVAREDFAAARTTPAVADVAPATPAADVLVLDASGQLGGEVRSMLPAAIRVGTVATLEAALAELVARETAVLVAVLGGQGDDTVDAIKRLKQLRPAMLVIVVSPMQDSRLAIDLINHGQVFRFLLAPPVRELLRRSLASALERHAQLRATPRLQRRHEVEHVARSPAPSLPGRILDYWRRLRDGAAR